MTSRIALGTVQFGMGYGISNTRGQVGCDEAARMLHLARDRGVDTIDTAVVYGESERVLGEIGITGLRVFTKLPALPGGVANISSWVRQSIGESLERLRIETLAGVLLHHPADLLTPSGEELYRALQTLRTQGLAERIGYSIYGTDELDKLFAHYFPQVIQAPFNVFDQRLARSGWLERLHSAGTEVHTRSTFLQGLLLMDAKSRPRKFDRWASQFERWEHWLGVQGVTPLHGALCCVLQERRIDRVVVGATSTAELEQILASAERNSLPMPEAISIADEDLIDPSRWSRL